MTPSTTYTLEKVPTSRFADDRGNIIVSGGEWRASFADGRSFAHGNKAIVVRLANAYAKGGEAAVAAAAR